MCMPHCTWDKFWDTLGNSGARSFGLFDDLMSFFDTMNVYSTTQENISNIKEYQDFLELFRGRPKLRENIIETGNAKYQMDEMSFTLMGFTETEQALPIIEDCNHNVRRFTSRLLWYFPKPVFCRLEDSLLTLDESVKVSQFQSQLVHFLATLYANGETTYTIEDDDKVTTVMVEREMFTLTEAANQAFATVHDKWEMNVCRKYRHDDFVAGLYSKGKSHVLRMAVPIQKLLLFWNTVKNVENDSSKEEDQRLNYGCRLIGAQAVNIASSIVSTCLAQLWTKTLGTHKVEQMNLHPLLRKEKCR